MTQAQTPKTAEDRGAETVDEWLHLAYCPNCGAKLQLLKCKARCPRCNFFQDCSDTIV